MRLSRPLSLCCLVLVASALAGGEADPAALVQRIRVQPDLAPDCSSLKAMVESVTRDCRSNDQKAVAIYDFMQLTHYHRQYPAEEGGIPVLKEITNYGWSLCGGLHAEQSALWRQLGWGWRFVGWAGHTTVEAQYDNRWHYLDVFLKFYAWMPDGKGGRTIAGEDDLTQDSKGLVGDAFVLDKGKNTVYMASNRCESVGGKANWRAPSFLSCGDGIGDVIAGLKTHHVNGSPDTWAGINHSDGDYRTDVDLAPGFALTSAWDPIADAWYWSGSNAPPGHTCPGHKDTRNDPGIGLILEPYLNAGPCRSYANGMLTFAPDLSGKGAGDGFLSSDNLAWAGGALAPATPGKPAVAVFRLASPYIMTRARGTADGAKVEVSSDGGKTYAEVDAKDFSAVVKGKLAALVRLTFQEPLKTLRFEVVFQNNPGALPYLSPGKNVVAVSVADAAKLGGNSLVVTYAYRLGSRSKSYDQLCEQGKEIAKQHNATWSDTIVYVRRSFTAKDLPAKFDIDCPTPKGQYPVYPRMLFVRREILSPGAAPLPLPEGAVEAKPIGANEELLSLPNPFMVGAEEPPVVKPRAVKTVELPLQYVEYASAKGEIAKAGTLRWPKNDAEAGKVVAGVVVIGGDLAGLPAKGIPAARLCVPVVNAHASAPSQLGVVLLPAPLKPGDPLDVGKLPDAQGVGVIPKQPADAPEYAPAKVFPIDVTRAIRAVAAKEAAFNGLALRIVPNRSVDEGYTVRCNVSASEKIVLQVDIYADDQ